MEVVQQEAAVTQQAPQRSRWQQPGVPELVAEIGDWVLAMRRCAAGYGSLHQSLLTHQGQVPDGERQKGLPLFSYKASLNGRDAVDVVLDVKDVEPEFIPHVLIPLINTQAKGLLEAAQEVAERVALVIKILTGGRAQAKETNNDGGGVQA